MIHIPIPKTGSGTIKSIWPGKYDRFGTAGHFTARWAKRYGFEHGFAFVRLPCERMVSWWAYRTRGQTPFEDWVFDHWHNPQRVDPFYMWTPQTRWLTDGPPIEGSGFDINEAIHTLGDEDGDFLVDVYDFANYREVLAEMFPGVRLPENNKSKHQRWPVHMTPKVHELVHDVFALDFKRLGLSCHVR